MALQQYSVNQYPIQTLLTWIDSNEIAIPEIQRPFVWSATKVRDLIDSLYKGYPVGYIIAWRNPTIKLKDGTKSDTNKRILIDGQQRITALMASLRGKEIINKDYKRVNIKIAFNPIDNRFEVSNPAIEKNRVWISDISPIFSLDFNTYEFVNQYIKDNPTLIANDIFKTIESLKAIINNQIGLIELNSNLDIDTVTEIFIRINSKGAVLSQADFAMSKIAANESYGGNDLRKSIDYFSHLIVAPEFYQQIKEFDEDFTKTDYFKAMKWLKNKNDNLYIPSYTDMLRVAFTYQFKRGKLEDLVALLSGRNFESREYEEEIAKESFYHLKEAIMQFMNETNFKRFLMIINSAGFIDFSMIRSQNALNFAYIVYLTLKKQKLNPAKIESYVKRWYVMSVLTKRYSASPESAFDYDIKRIDSIGIEKYLNDIELAELSKAFWEVALPQHLTTSVASSPHFHIYLASQVYNNDKGFLSKDITVSSLIIHRGDIHHIFPRNYLKKYGFTKGRYNQIANYVMMQSEINIQIGDKEPSKYFSELLEQCNKGEIKYGAITNIDELKDNFKMHCIPDGIESMGIEDYDEFLEKRRKLMAKKIEAYYFKL